MINSHILDVLNNNIEFIIEIPNEFLSITEFSVKIENLTFMAFGYIMLTKPK